MGLKYMLLVVRFLVRLAIGGTIVVKEKKGKKEIPSSRQQLAGWLGLHLLTQ